MKDSQGVVYAFLPSELFEKGEKSNVHTAPEITNVKNHKEETQMKNELKLISMDTVEAENVQWLWYPYIPLGKITIVQGDPGEG